MNTRVLVCVVLLGLADASEPNVTMALTPTPAAVDTLVSVGAHELHFVVHRGRLPIAVVLEAGGGADLTSWGDLPHRLAVGTGATVVAYDRAGLGGSSLPFSELTPAQEIRDLHFALNHLGVPESRVVVATSYGAMLALVNAASFPDEVVPLALVDPMNARFIRTTGDFIFSTAPEILNPSTDRERVIVRMVRTFPALTEEVAALEPELHQPMVVITAGDRWWGREDVDTAWRRSHVALAAARPQRHLIIAEGSDHDIPAKRPDVITAAVQRLLTDLSN